MPVITDKKPYNYTDDDKSLGRAVLAVRGLDQSWMPKGSCRNYPAGRQPDGSTLWHADMTDKRYPTRAERDHNALATVALMICRNCPVQYECADFAVRSEACAGTYGVRLSNLRWLQEGMNRSVLDRGRTSGLPVEVFVSNVRFRRP